MGRPAQAGDGGEQGWTYPGRCVAAWFSSLVGDGHIAWCPQRQRLGQQRPLTPPQSHTHHATAITHTTTATTTSNTLHHSAGKNTAKRVLLAANTFRKAAEAGLFPKDHKAVIPKGFPINIEKDLCDKVTKAWGEAVDLSAASASWEPTEEVRKKWAGMLELANGQSSKELAGGKTTWRKRKVASEFRITGKVAMMKCLEEADDAAVEGAAVSQTHLDKKGAGIPMRIKIRVEVQEAGGTEAYEANATLTKSLEVQYNLEKGIWYDKVKNKETLVEKPLVREVVGPDGEKKNLIYVVIKAK